MNNLINSTVQMKKENKDDFGNTIFSPPLYQQRYLKVIEILENHMHNKNLLKVVDIGSAELSFFKYLKRTENIREVVLLDIDFHLLQDHLHWVNPLPCDFIIQKRNPFVVSVVCADAKFLHPSLLNADVITMIEFIEHIHLDELPSIVTNIFGVVQPNLVIVTTPNADYNKHFPSLKAGQFRHYDHKFEWTEKQFREWCNNIVEKYKFFSVSFSGCGKDEDSIFCSQIGIFINQKPRKQELDSLLLSKSSNDIDACKSCQGCMIPKKEFIGCNTLHSVEYPFDSRSSKQTCIDYIRSSLYELETWIKIQIKLSNYDPYVLVPYSSVHSCDCSVYNMEKHEHMAHEASAAVDSIGSLHVCNEYDRLVTDNCEKKTDTKIILGELADSFQTEILASSRQKQNFLSNRKFISTSEEIDNNNNNYRGLKFLNQTSNTKTNNPLIQDKSSVAEKFANSAEFAIVTIDEDFKMAEYNADAGTCLFCNFYYFEFEQLLFFTISTFCKWAKILHGSEEIILEALKLDKMISYDANKKMIQLSLDQHSDTSSDTA